MKTNTLKLVLPALALLLVGAETPLQAKPPPWARATQSASRRVAPPNLLGGRIYNANGVNFTRLIRADRLKGLGLTKNAEIRQTGPSRYVRSPGESRHIQFLGTGGYVTGPGGAKYYLAQFRDLANPATRFNTGSGHEIRWSAGGMQFSQHVNFRDLSAQQAAGKKSGWTFNFSRPTSRTTARTPTQWTRGPAYQPSRSASTVSRASTTGKSSSQHASGGVIYDPPQ